MLTGDSVPRLPRGVRLHEDKVRGEWTLLGPERVFKMDEIAVAILQRCTGEATLNQVERGLAEEFGADPEEVSSDVREFLAGMIDKGMVVL
jgi:pyrroloquinoline quinone biosynthesis protein D